MGEFIDADRAARALEASPDEAEQAYVSPELGANFFQVLGNVATQWVNSKVPGLGPAINPGYYKDLAKQQALQRQPQQTAQAAGGAPIAQAKPGLPSWVLPASIAGGAAILAIILAVSLGGRRRNPEGKTRFRRRRRFSRKSLRRSGLRRRAIRRNASFKTAASEWPRAAGSAGSDGIRSARNTQGMGTRGS